MVNFLLFAHASQILRMGTTWNLIHLAAIIFCLALPKWRWRAVPLAVFSTFVFFFQYEQIPGTFFLLWIGTVIVALFESPAPNLQRLMLLGYGVPFLQKLNSAYLNPSGSCSYHIFELVPFISTNEAREAMGSLWPPLTLLIEGFNWIGWMIPGMPFYTSMVTLVFHASVVVAGIYTIPMIMVALQSSWIDTKERDCFSWFWRIHLTLGLPFLLRKLVYSFGISHNIPSVVFDYATFALLANFAIFCIRHRRNYRPQWWRSIKDKGALALIAFMIFWAAQPFLGLTSVHSMNMHSNLLVKEGTSNHYIFPTYQVLGDLQTPAITVEEYARRIREACPHEPVFANDFGMNFYQYGLIPYLPFEVISEFETQKRIDRCQGRPLGWRQFVILGPYDNSIPNRCRK